MEHGAAQLSAGLLTMLPAFESIYPGARDLGAVAPSTPMTVGLALSPNDPRALDAYVYAEYTPGSPAYGHELNPQKFQTYFSPSAADYRAVQSYYAAYGLSTITTPDRLMIGLTGTAGHISNAFHTSFHRFQLTDGADVYGASQSVVVPAGLSIDGVTGMTNAWGPRPTDINPGQVEAAAAGWAHSEKTATPGTWTCTSGTQGCDEPGYYGEYPLFNAGDTGQGVNVGIVDAYDSAETQSQLLSSEQSFASGAGLPAPHENFWYPIPGAGNLNTSASSGWAGETDLDQHMAFMDAPGANIDVTFASDSSFAVYEAVDFLVAHNLTQTISMSWGESDVGNMQAPPQGPCMPYYSCNASYDGSYAFLHPVFAEAVAEGITPFAAAGDCGAADGTYTVATDYPSSDPFVVGVGGTQLNGSGSTYAGETGWSGNGTGCTANTGGGGGGYAPWAQPWWQHGPGQLTHHLRGVPDVSADSADGTSQASPMWAGWVAVADQIHGGGLGLIGPSMYNILSNATEYAAYFHDIKTGNNGYAAGTGWDPITGIGTPVTGALLPALGRYLPPVHGSLNVSLAATPTSGSAPLSVTFTASASGGTPPYWYDFVPGLYLGQVSNTPSITYPYASAGPYYATVVAWDAAGNSSISNPVLVHVGDSALTATLAASATHVLVGQTVTFTGGASGGTAPYQFTYFYGDGTYGYNRSTSATHAYLSPGTYCAYAFVTDGAATQNGGVTNPVCVTASYSSGSGPTISSFTASPSTITVGGTTYLNVSASGGTGPLAYAYSGLPAPCASSNSSAITCTPSAVGGPYSITVTVSDSASPRHTTSATTSFTVTSTGGTGPTISTFTASPSSIPAGGTTYLNVTASGGVGPLTYAYSGLPTPCASSNSSSITCAPASSGGPYTITATVSDSAPSPHSTSATTSFTVTPSGGTGPTISSFTASPASIPAGGTTYLNVTASGGVGPLSYAYSGLPAPCASSNSSSITCAPTSSGGPYTITVTVKDSASTPRSTSATTSFTVTPSGGTGPTISSFTASPSSIPAGGTTYLNVTASGGVGPLSYSYSGLPAPCTSTNASRITCAPTSSGGPYTITATVKDSASSPHTTAATATFTVTPAPLAISSLTASPASIPSGGTTFLNVTATGGYPAYTYLYNGLPSDCASANASTLTCSSILAGTYDVTVKVTDTASNSATRSAPFTVQPSVASKPVVSQFYASPSPLALGGQTTFYVSATGGAPPYTYSYVGLPTGCSSSNSGSLSCTPTGTGTFNVTVTVTDTRGQSALANTSVVVTAAPSSGPGSTGILSGWSLWILLAVVVVAVVIAAVLVSRRRKGPGNATPPGYLPPGATSASPPWQAPPGAPPPAPWQE